MSNVTVQARYQFTAVEFMTANRWVLKSKARPGMRVAGMLVAVVLAAFGGWYIFTDATHVLGYFLLVVGLLGLAVPLLMRLSLMRAIQRDPAKDSWVEWRIDDEGTRVIVAGVERTSVTWSAYTQALVTHEGYLLYRGKQRLSWLPFKAFASQTERDAVQARIERHIADIRQVV